MNWEKIFGLDAKSLYQSINGFWYLFIFYCLVTISMSYKNHNEMVIPINYRLSMPQQGTWENPSNDSYKVTTSDSGKFELYIDTKGYPKELIINKLSQLLYLFIIGFILLQIRGLAKSILDDKPFGKSNISRLKRIGHAIIILGVIHPLINRYLAALAEDHITISGLELWPYTYIDWSYYVLGLVFLLIARVFKKGIELREENALTI